MRTLENGVYAAALTPLHPNLHCNDQILTEHCLHLIDRGCKGVALFGTTGEGASFSVEEKKKTLKSVISKGLDPNKIIIGNGSSCLQDTVNIATATVEHNCLACLMAPPCFFKNVQEEGVISFYREVIQRALHPNLRIILYHIPQYTGVPITAHIVQTLCREFPNTVIGLKESEGNLTLIQETLKAVPNCVVFAGNPEQIPLALNCGASGTISGIANLCPELVCDLYENRDITQLEKKISLLHNRPFIASCKALLSDNKNACWDLVRPPLVSLGKEEKELLQHLYNNP